MDEIKRDSLPEQTADEEQVPTYEGVGSFPPQRQAAPIEPEQKPAAAPATHQPSVQQLADELAQKKSLGGPVGPPQTIPPSTPVTAGDIHTMPDKFISKPKSKKAGKQVSGKRMIMIVIVVAIVLGAITTGAYIYLQQPGNFITGGGVIPPDQDQNVADQNVPDDTNTDAGDANGSGTSDDVVAQQTTRDQQRIDDILIIAEALEAYYKQFEAYPQFLSVIPKTILEKAPTDPQTGITYTYAATKNRQSYSIIFDIESGVRFKDSDLTPGEWEFLPEDFQDDDVTPDDTPVDTPPQPPGNIDSDGDGLTAAEERVFRTSPVVPDTDSDGFRDAVEVKNFFSPIQSGAVTLEQAGLVRLFTHEEHNYSLYYPAAWLVNKSPNDTEETIITASTGEQFNIKVSDNADGLTSWEWYSQEVSLDFNEDNVDIIQIAELEAVRTLDGLQVYLATPDRTITIVYIVSSTQSIDYPNIFNLILDTLTLL